MSTLLSLDRDLTPCRGICSSTALGTEFCIGCGRTLQQIADWATYTNKEKRDIMRKIREKEA